MSYASSYSVQPSSFSEQSYSQQVLQKVAKVQNDLCRYLQAQYHDALISDGNFIPSELVEPVSQLQQSINRQIIKQADLTQQINNLTFQLKKVEGEIRAYEEIQVQSSKLLVQEDVQKKKGQFKQTINLQQACQEEENHLAVQSQKLKEQLQQKKKNQEQVVTHLTKTIRSLEDQIRGWQKKIDNLKEKIDAKNSSSNKQVAKKSHKDWQPKESSSNQSMKKMQQDRTIALQLNIAKLKQYILANQQFLDE